MWNSLPATKRQITGYGQFRQHLKTCLFKSQRVVTLGYYKYSYLLTYLEDVCLLCRSSPVLLRFSKQLKKGLSDSSSEGFTPPSTSVCKSSGAPSSTVSTSNVETCQGNLCLTDSLTQQHSSISSLPSKLTPASDMMSHTWRLDKNIFANVRLTEASSDRPMETEAAANRTTFSDSADNEISVECSKSEVSLSFSNGEENVESPSVSCGNGSTTPPITPASVTANDKKVTKMQLRESDLLHSGLEEDFSAMSSCAHDSAETLKSVVDGNINGCRSLVTERDFMPQSPMAEERCQPVSSEDTDALQLQLAETNSCTVPVSQFNAQTCTATTTMPAALHRAPSCGSPTPCKDVPPDSSSTVFSRSSKVSVSRFEGKIPRTTAERDLSQLSATVPEEPEKADGGGSVSKCPVFDETGINVERNYLVTSDVPVPNYSISHLQQLPDINPVEGNHKIELRKDMAEPNPCISDESVIPFADTPETGSCMEVRKDFDKTNSVVPISGYTVSDLQELSNTTPAGGDCQVEKQKDIAVTNSVEPDECISDESIVSQILAADCYPPDSLVSNFSELQKWREMVSPLVAGKPRSTAVEDNNSSVTAEDVNSNSFVDDDSVKDLIQSAELDMSRQSREIFGTSHQHGDLALVHSSDGWMFDDKELQDVLCALLNSCHVDSTNPDNQLPLGDAAAADDGDDDDAESCASSATEVYVDSPEDLKLDDVGSRCGSPQDKDSDGTVSLLSVVLDGDGLDLVDSTSDGFQNIYSSLVGAAAVDAGLPSGANELNSRTGCTDAGTANLSAFAAEQNLTSLLDREGSSAVMALDARLVKNLPCPAASVASLCDKLEDSGQEPKKEEEDHVQTDVGGKTGARSVRCHCSELHTSKKSCRSSLRMPEKLAEIDPASPLLACRPPPLSIRCGKYGADTHRTSDVAEGSENAAVSPASVAPAVPGDETVNRVRSRKRKSSGVSHAENDSDDVKRSSSIAKTRSREKRTVEISPVENDGNAKCSSSIDEMKSAEKCSVEIAPAAKNRGKKHKKVPLKSFRSADKIQVASGNIGKSSASETDKYTFRISASQVDKPVNYTCSMLKGRTLSEKRPKGRSLRSEQIQQTTFTLEHTRTGSMRTVILRKPTCPPMLSTGKTSPSNWKIDHSRNQQQLSCSQNQTEIPHRKKGKKQPNSLPEKPRQQISADNGGDCAERWNKVGSETENETDEEFSLKMILRKPPCPPVLSSGETAPPKWKIDRGRSQRQLKLSQNQKEIQHKKKEKKPSNTLEKRSRQITAGNSDFVERRDEVKVEIQHQKKEEKQPNGAEKPRRISADNSESEERQNRVGSEAENETDEEFSLKKMMLRSYRSSGIKQDRGHSNNSNRASRDNRSHRKSRSGNSQCASDPEKRDGSTESQGKRRKRCLLLAQLENSEGFVAERNVSQQQHHDSSLLWSDSNMLSREERALQVRSCRIALCRLLLSFLIVCIIVLLYSLFSNSAPQGCKCAQ